MSESGYLWGFIVSVINRIWYDNESKGYSQALMQKFWNDYYTQNSNTPWTKPDSDFVAVASTLPCGKALDLGSGEGAESIWLASQGWDVTAVDFSSVALDTIAQICTRQGFAVTGITSDILAYDSTDRYDLVYIGFIHLVSNERKQMMAQAVRLLVTGGTLLYIGIVRSDNPSDSDIPPEYLATLDEIVQELAGFTIERADVRYRTIGCPEGDFAAHVMVVCAKKQ